MKYLTTTALAALFAGAIGAVAVLPQAYADNAATPDAAAPAVTAPAPDAGNAAGMPGPGQRGMMRHWGPGQRDGARASLLDIACGPRAAEALEIGLVHLQYAVQPTATQQPLLDTLKTTALADQKTFADACKTAMGNVRPADGKVDILARLQARLAIDTAKVTAMNDVLPKFKAFFDSLSDDQKAKLTPPGMQGARVGFNGGMGMRGMHHHPGQMRPGAGNNGDAKPAPGDADVAPLTPDAQDSPA